MDLKKRVGIRIKTFRERRSWNQDVLAERIGRTVNAVSSLERGNSLPGFETLEKLSEALEIPIEDFFDGGYKGKFSRKRVAQIAKVIDTVRSLPDSTLEIAADQIQALTKRGK